MMQQDIRHLKDGAIDLVAGSLGGTAVVYVGQPLDTVKVKMQAFPSLYSSLIDCFIKTWRADGIARGLYAGSVPALVSNITENATLFFCYGFCQKLMQTMTRTDSVAELSVLSNACAGFIASFFSSLAITPTDLVKCKLQAMHEMSTGPNAVRIGPAKLAGHILREEGWRGLFRGFVPTLAREMPGYFFFFGGYEGARTLLAHHAQSKDDIGPLKTMVAGAIGGICFWTSTFPIDVAKSQIQIGKSRKNMVAVMIDIGKTEGVRGLYSGLTPTLLRTVPTTATLFVVYEYSKKLLHEVC